MRLNSENKLDEVDNSLTLIVEDFEQFRSICMEVCDALVRFESLFDEANYDLLMRETGSFFSSVNRIMLEHWFLSVVKLGDRAQSNGNNNLSIEYINQQLKGQSLLTVEVCKLSDVLLSFINPLKELRHKRLAHNDKQFLLVEGLGAFEKSEGYEFLENLNVYCDKVGELIGAGPFSFSSLVGEPDSDVGVRALLGALGGVELENG